MRIEEIHAKNWCGHEDTKIATPHRMTLVIGPNEAGKSTLIAAIECAITGLATTLGYTTKKAQGASAIRFGAKEAVLSVLFRTDEGTRAQVRRRLKPDGGQKLEVLTIEQGQEDWHPIPGSQGVVQGALLDTLGMDADQATATFNAWHLLSLDPKKRSALLFSTVADGDVEEQACDELQKLGIAEEDAKRYAIVIATDGFKEASKQAVEARVRAGQDRDHQAEQLQAKPPPFFGETDLRTIDEPTIRQQLAELETERSGKLETRGAVRTSGTRLLEGLERREEELSGAIEALQARLPGPDESIEDERSTLEQMAEQVRIHESQLTPLQEEQKRLDAMADGEAVTLEVVETCPHYPGEMACPVTSKKLAAHAKGLNDSLDARKEAAEKHRPGVEQLEKDLDSWRADHREQSEKVTGWKEATEEAERLGAQLREVKASIESARSYVADAPPEEQLSADIEALGERLERGRRMLEAKSAVDAFDEAAIETKREAADVRWRTADAIAKALLECETRMATSMASEFLDVARTYGEATDLGPIVIGDDGAFEVVRVSSAFTGKRFRVEQLSRSARLRLGLALQAATRAATRFPALILDEADVFDGERQGLVMSAILENEEQSIVFGTLQLEEPPKPWSDDVGVVYVAPGENGLSVSEISA